MAAMKTTKINGVYSVSNVQKGMKNIERTRKEINSMNSQVTTYELNKPQPYEAYETWPDDIKKDYLKRLCWTHCGSQAWIADMLGVPQTKVSKEMRRLGVPTRNRGGDTYGDFEKRRAEWESFLRGGTLVKDMIPEETKRRLEEMASDICEPAKPAVGKQVSLVAVQEPVMPPHIVTIRRDMMAKLNSITNEEFADFANKLWTKEIGYHEQASEMMCETCRRLFGAERCGHGCPITFRKWLEVDDTDAGDLELLKWWAKEDTRRLAGSEGV